MHISDVFEEWLAHSEEGNGWLVKVLDRHPALRAHLLDQCRDLAEEGHAQVGETEDERAQDEREYFRGLGV